MQTFIWCFVNSVRESNLAGRLILIKIPGGVKEENLMKYPRINVVLGSVGLSIGQADKFNYFRSQV